jgi:outer membrane receptor protein involved in Fe transport
VDAAIEYNPTSIRNVHQVQFTGSWMQRTGAHRIKAGFLWDTQSGHETYQIIPASRLALDALAALDPSLAPAGTAGSEMDVDGNPVYTPSSGTTPTLSVDRSGYYKAAYVQDTWALGRLTANYGLRFDTYFQTQNLGQPDVSKSLFSPRANFSYKASARDNLRWSYDKLFNIPPLAQGAIVGEPIVPETLDQYDVSWEHRVGRGQTFSAAYYYKNIRNQVDTGLLIPGSQIGLYSAVSLDEGAVHGVELSYDWTAQNGIDAYINYTHSAAKPNGKDNTGADVDDFNDHDQRDTLGVGFAYTARSGASGAVVVNYGSGLASSVVQPDGPRTPRTQVDLHLASGDRLFRGHGGLSLDVDNLFDAATVINFQSAFSGTRFMMRRRLTLGASWKF